MAAIKPLEQSSDKWQRRASVSQPDYTSGVENPRRPWAQSTTAAGQNYRQGVIAAANAGRFEAGVRAAGEDRWRSSSLEKGPSRFVEGVQLSVDRWQSGFQPYQQAISSLNLPARGPKGSPQNLQRVSAVAQALRQLKERAGRSS